MYYTNYFSKTERFQMLDLIGKKYSKSRLQNSCVSTTTASCLVKKAQVAAGE